MAVALNAGPSLKYSVELLKTFNLVITSLRPTPCTRKGCFVDIELGFTESAGRNRATGVRDLLQSCLGGDKVVNQPTKRGVLPRNELIDEFFEHQRRVPDPSVQVVRV